ncbi:glycosyltransferase family 2 protein [Colwellia piezophila]|uniref:glycosyltransferase family 2 protein n=1 Tax=Colwellia piezophila TaxID=211668 RepID=UPI0003670B99|nr:glycosyltransferase family 2 protein [Colwellia piezophila]
MKFHLIIAMYNVEEWIVENIDMLRQQTYQSFNVVIIDDISTDKTVTLANDAINGDKRFNFVINTEKKYKTRNVVDGITYANAAPEDVIILLDGDDRLFDKNVLQTVADTYQQDDCWMTYGSFIRSAGRKKNNKAYKQSVIDEHSYRQNKWLASHLKTFKYALWCKLNMDIFQVSELDVKNAVKRSLLSFNLKRWFAWRKIKANDLHDDSGLYIKRVDDKAFSYPMLEMSGEKASFIDSPLYYYRNDVTDYSSAMRNFGVQNSEKQYTRIIRDILIHKKPYTRLTSLS